MIPRDPEQINALIRIVLLMSVVIAGAATDLWKGKVYNALTIPVMCAGLWLGYVPGGWSEGEFCLARSLQGLAVGGGIFLAAHALGRMGAGDFKLMAAVGALSGPRFALVATFYTALAGAVLAIVYLIYRGRLRDGLRDSLRMLWPFRRKRPAPNQAGAKESALRLTVPYAVAIAAGTLWAFMSLGGLR